jgi:hypothetical protein
LLIKPKEEEEVDLEEEEVDEEDEMRPAAATVEDAAIVNILYSFVFKFFFLWRSFSCFCSSRSTQTFADIISFILGAKKEKSAAHINQKAFSLLCFFTERRKKFTHLAKRGKETAHAKVKTPLIVAHLLFHTSKCLKRSAHPEC